MKKFAPIAAALLFASFAMTSCKKDYQCECKVNGQVVSTGTFKATKKDAKAACNTSSSVAGVSCELK